VKLLERIFESDSRDTHVKIYPLGDIHIGAHNCAEDKLKSHVRRIAQDPNAYWIGGGDVLDAVVLNDSKRFDPTIVPDWMLKGSANNIRMNIKDMLRAQRNRFYEILDPIRDKCLGLIEGNHEYSIMKYHNRDLQSELCQHFKCEDLTDCAFLRLRFRRRKGKSVKADGQPDMTSDTVRMFITHGNGGGRSSGAEPMSLYRLAADKECDIVLKGHSHSFCIHPPIPMLSIPGHGALPESPIVYDKYAANWGSFVYTYATGPSTYASRANYPCRPMYSVEAVITPFRQHGRGKPESTSIQLNGVRL
jgi:hypothetical protein